MNEETTDLTGPHRHKKIIIKKIKNKKKKKKKDNTEITETRKINSVYRTDIHDYRKHTKDD